MHRFFYTRVQKYVEIPFLIACIPGRGRGPRKHTAIFKSSTENGSRSFAFVCYPATYLGRNGSGTCPELCGYYSFPIAKTTFKTVWLRGQSHSTHTHTHIYIPLYC